MIAALLLHASSAAPGLQHAIEPLELERGLSTKCYFVGIAPRTDPKNPGRRIIVNPPTFVYGKQAAVNQILKACNVKKR